MDRTGCCCVSGCCRCRPPPPPFQTLCCRCLLFPCRVAACSCTAAAATFFLPGCSVWVREGTVRDLVGNANVVRPSLTVKYRPSSSGLQAGAIVANVFFASSLALCTAASYVHSALLPFSHGVLGELQPCTVVWLSGCAVLQLNVVVWLLWDERRLPSCCPVPRACPAADVLVPACWR